MENIITKGTEVVIGEQKLTMRRLNTLDVITVSTIISKVYDEDMLDLKEGNESKFVGYILSAIPVAQDDIISLLSNLVGLTPDQFYELPPEAIFVVVEALAKSEDLKRFFEQVKGTLQRLLQARAK